MAKIIKKVQNKTKKYKKRQVPMIGTCFWKHSGRSAFYFSVPDGLT